MAKYIVTGVVTISMYTEVEAESIEEAKALASARANCSLEDPERMGESVQEVWCHSGEIDGEVTITGVDAGE